MGCTVSTELRAAELKNKEVERDIKRGQDSKKPVIKILLLGAGESGKSTILKQMKIIHKNGYTPEELEEYRVIIQSNVAQFFDQLIKIYKSQSEFKCSDNEDSCMTTVADFWTAGSFSSTPPPVQQAMITLWKNPDFQKLIEKAESFHVNVAIRKLANELERIFTPGYIPTEADVLLSRVKTTGIKQLEFEYKNTSFIICDVGGQRSERKKWVYAFEGVQAILFFVAISEYDQILEEDATVNRMQECFKLFDSILESPWFANSSIILLLNKTDLFEEKIKYSNFQTYFPDFKGDPHSLQETQDYIRRRFESLNKKKDQREIYTHFTNATQTTQMAAVFDAVSDFIMKKNLRDYGLY